MSTLRIVSVLTLMSITFAYAEEGGIKREILRAATVQPGQPRIVSSASAKMMGKPELVTQNKNAEEGGQGSSQGAQGSGQMTATLHAMPVPTTGDPVVDAQIKALTIEMETKMKAIGDEYRLKIKAVVGNRPLKNGVMMATGTPGSLAKRPMDGHMGTSTREHAEVRASSTREGGDHMPMRDMRMSTTTPRGVVRGEMIKLGQDEGGHSMQEGIGAQFSTFFRTMFGGNK